MLESAPLLRSVILREDCRTPVRRARGARADVFTRTAAAPVAPTPFRAWWKASRPATLSIAVVPVLIGTALAWRAGAAIVVAAAGGDKPEEKLNGVLKRTAQLQLAFGALLAVALVL